MIMEKWMIEFSFNVYVTIIFIIVLYLSFKNFEEKDDGTLS